MSLRNERKETDSADDKWDGVVWNESCTKGTVRMMDDGSTLHVKASIGF